jgi:hypothetical protein
MSLGQGPEGIFPELGPDIGFRLPQYVVLERLENAYKLLRRDPQQIRTALIRQGQKFVQEQVYPAVTRRATPCYTGYPLEESQVPGIGVTLQQSSEDTGRQVVGGKVEERAQGDSIVSIYGTFMTTSVQLAHYCRSQAEADVLGQLTVFLLLALRDKLETEDGLMEQSVMLADINPNPNFRPENAFMRMALFRCSHLDTWGVARSPLIREIDVGYNEGGILAWE